jgi:hypothetical protein
MGFVRALAVADSRPTPRLSAAVPGTAAAIPLMSMIPLLPRPLLSIYAWLLARPCVGGAVTCADMTVDDLRPGLFVGRSVDSSPGISGFAGDTAR